MKLSWLIGETGPRADERRGWVEDGAVALIAAVALMLIVMAWGCASVPVPPPVQPPPTPPPIEIKHEPVCVPPGLVTGCWHQPPGQNWQFIPPVVAPVTRCPKPLAPGARVYLALKPYGQGWDSSPRVVGDPDFCYAIHGVRVNDCHLEGWSDRLGCELELLGGCPEWEYRATSADPWQAARQSGSGAITVDHFGNTAIRDDPQTPAFEGEPAVCGKQRDPRGEPKAGFFVIAHGEGELRVCRPDHDPTGCSDAKAVSY